MRSLICHPTAQACSTSGSGSRPLPACVRALSRCRTSSAFRTARAAARRTASGAFFNTSSRLNAGPASSPLSRETDPDTAEPLVEEVMNPHPVLLTDTMPIKEAVHLMLDRDVAGAPVVDGAGKLVGVLSEKDLIFKGAGTPADHWIIPPVFIGALDAYVYLKDNKKIEEESHKILAKTVREAMTAEVVHYVTPQCTMAKAAQLMLNHDINLLPVQEADGRVVGVITRHDILRGIYASNNAFL